MASIVENLRLLADETRLRLLLLLRREELSVVELQEVLGMGQSRISSHLAQMRQARLVQDRRAGKNILYKFALPADQPEVLAILEASARGLPTAAADARALVLILQKRQDKAREYFDQLAGRFGRSYCPGRTWEGVARLLFALVPPMVIADLGAGEGTLAQLLARRAERVIAVDNSEKMVEFGSALALRHGYSNLEFRLGDLESPPIEPGSVDLVLLSQALHHATHPQKALQAAHALLRPGGRVAILDLQAHQFEQARELYADTWLGFSEAHLLEMLEVAGFREVQISTVSRDEHNPQFQTLLALGSK